MSEGTCLIKVPFDRFVQSIMSLKLRLQKLQDQLHPKLFLSASPHKRALEKSFSRNFRPNFSAKFHKKYRKFNQRREPFRLSVGVINISTSLQRKILAKSFSGAKEEICENFLGTTKNRERVQLKQKRC